MADDTPPSHLGEAGPSRKGAHRPPAGGWEDKAPGPVRHRLNKTISAACLPCKRGHLACDDSRPCRRCVGLGRQDQCIDVPQKKRGRPKLPPNSGASAKRTSLSAAAGSAVSTPAPSPRRKPIALATTMSSLSTASGNAIASPHGGPSSSLPSPAIPTSASSSSSSSSYFSRGPVPSSSSAAPSLFPPDFSLSGPSSSSYPPRIVTLATTTEFLIIRSSESSVPLLGLPSSRLRESWLGSMLSAEDMLALDPVREWLTAPPGLVLTTSTETVALVEELSEQAVESPAAGTPYPDRDVTVKRSDGAWTDFNLRMHLGRGAGLDLRNPQTFDRAYIVISFLASRPILPFSGMGLTISSRASSRTTRAASRSPPLPSLLGRPPSPSRSLARPSSPSSSSLSLAVSRFHQTRTPHSSRPSSPASSAPQHPYHHHQQFQHQHQSRSQHPTDHHHQQQQSLQYHQANDPHLPTLPPISSITASIDHTILPPRPASSSAVLLNPFHPSLLHSRPATSSASLFSSTYRSNPNSHSTSGSVTDRRPSSSGSNVFSHIPPLSDHQHHHPRGETPILPSPLVLPQGYHYDPYRPSTALSSSSASRFLSSAQGLPSSSTMSKDPTAPSAGGSSVDPGQGSAGGASLGVGGGWRDGGEGGLRSFAAMGSWPSSTGGSSRGSFSMDEDQRLLSGTGSLPPPPPAPSSSSAWGGPVRGAGGQRGRISTGTR